MVQEKKIHVFEYEFHADSSICIVKAIGEIDFEESTNAMKYVASHPEFDIGFKIIVDLTEMNYHPSYEDLLGIVDTLKLLKESFTNKMALITKPKMSIVAKLVSVYCELAGMKMKSFISIEEANLWISELKEKLSE